MKYLLIALTLLASIAAIAQSENENFYLSENEVSWKKVFETNKTKAEIIEYYKESGLFWSTETIADTLFCKLKQKKINPDKTGVAGVPAIVNKTDYKGLVRIELKDKKYRIILSNIILVGDGEILRKGEEQTFEDNFLNKEHTEYRPGFLKKPNSIYNSTFTDLFEIKTVKKDNW